MSALRYISPAKRAGLLASGYKVQVVYRWIDVPYLDHPVQCSFYTAADIDDREGTIREHLHTLNARVLYARDLATGRFVALA